MPKFRVYLEAVASTTVEVEADSPEEAAEAAFNEHLPYSCHQCPEIEDWYFPPDERSTAKIENFVEEIGAQS